MAAATYDFNIEQGVPYSRVLALKDSEGAVLNLTGYSCRMHIRPYVSSDVILVNATSSNGKLIITNSTGLITISLSEEDTKLLIYSKSVYDLELLDSANKPIRLLKGNVIVSFEVTRE